jgi:hypothetical protein
MVDVLRHLRSTRCGSSHALVESWWRLEKKGIADAVPVPKP